jgi:hypothetical protein
MDVPSTILWRSIDVKASPRKSVILYLGWDIRAHRVFVEFRVYSFLTHLPKYPLFCLPLQVLGYIARKTRLKTLGTLCYFICVRLKMNIRPAYCVCGGGGGGVWVCVCARVYFE